MASQKDIQQEIDRLENLNILVTTYEEIAATHIRKIRTSVVQNRDFIENIDKIFQELKASHTREVAEMLKKHHKKDEKDLNKHNGKTVCVFLSANTGLYGDVVNKTFTLFLENIQKYDADVVIVGKLGLSMYEAQHIAKKTTYFDFPDNGTNTENLKTILNFLLPYEKILVFYGQFKSIVTQTAVISDIYGEQAIQDQTTTQATQDDVLKYMFEPSLEEILAYFESEIFASIFEQTINESQLAKNASRMRMLDNAMQNIGDTLKKQEQLKRQLAHRMMNSKQLNSLTGVALWKK